jgi:hypothetical protein
VKAHVGTAGNEEADGLAKRGGVSDVLRQVEVPECERKKRLGECVMSEWNKEWSEYKGGRQTKLFFPKVKLKQSRELLEYGRSRVGKLIRIFTGHNALNYHRHNIDNSINKICRFCLQSDETSWHLATECEAVETESRKCFLGEDIGGGEWEVGQMVDFSEITVVALALEGWEMEHDVWDEECDG